MPLTPADVHNVAFAKPPIGKRGYNEDEVDQFLDLVEDTLGQLLDENEDLRQQVEELNNELAQAGSGATSGRSSAASVDTAAIRREVEEELRAEYEKKLAQARAETAKAQDELQLAQAQAQADDTTIEEVHHV